MTDTMTVAEEARVISENETSRDVMANAASDNPNPDAPAITPTPQGGAPRGAGAAGTPGGEARDESAQQKPLDRVTTADRSRADIAARFKDKRAAAGGQVEFHGDMRDPSQTYAGFAPQPDDGTASLLTSPRLRGEVDAATAAAGEGDSQQSNASGTSPSPGSLTRSDLSPRGTPSRLLNGDPVAGRGDAVAPPVASAAPGDQPRLVKVKVHGREAWLPEAEVVAEAQKSLAAGNLLESAKEVLSGARNRTTDGGGQTTDPSSSLAPAQAGVRSPSADPFLALAQTLQLEDAAAAGHRLKQTIESETARARQEASHEAARQVRLENELAVSQKALAAFEQTHPELAADEFARDAVTTQVQREINADLQAAVSQGILKELPRSQDERNGLHTQLRAFGAPAARAIGDLFAAAGMKYETWREGRPTPAPQPQTTAPAAPRVELTTARQERRAQIPTQPTHGTAPPRVAPPPEQTTAQRRSAAITAMRKARGQIVA